MNKSTDVLIIGAGPAGLSAAIYAARGGAKVVVIEKGVAGGSPMYYNDIENYPGYVGKSSANLVENMIIQARELGVEINELQEVTSCSCENKEVVTLEETYKAKVLIIATGGHPKKLGVPGEDNFIGRGVSYCAVCDGPFYKDKVVAVIGGGNSAVEEACHLTKFASKVLLVHRRDKLRADKVIQEKALANPKIEFIWNAYVSEIWGDYLRTDYGNKVRYLYLMEEGEPASYEVDGVFPFIGFEPNSKLFSEEMIIRNGHILANADMETCVPGVYAIGDVRITKLRQVITAASDGAIAGNNAVKYIDSLKEPYVQ